MILDLLTLASLFAAAIAGGVNGYLLKALQKARKPKLTGDVILGIRPSSRKARLREEIKTVRGRYTWDEKDKNGMFEADIHLDADFGLPLGDGRTLYMADLDNYQVIRYEGKEAQLFAEELAADAAAKATKGETPVAVVSMKGDVLERKTVPVIQFEAACRNDDEKTPIFNRFGVKVGEITRLWARLPGTRLNKIRKDHRINQINNNLSNWFERFGKPLMVIGTVLSVALLVINLKMVWH